MIPFSFLARITPSSDNPQVGIGILGLTSDFECLIRIKFIPQLYQFQYLTSVHLKFLKKLTLTSILEPILVLASNLSTPEGKFKSAEANM